MCKSYRNAAVAAGVLLVTAVALPQLKAGQADEEVRMTFSAPVQIPGHVLPAGTYTFKRWDLTGNPHVIFVMDAEGTKLIGSVMYVPTYKDDLPLKFNEGGGADARPDVHVTFSEPPTGQPEILRSWNYPGDPAGFKLVYPKKAGEK
jgi:hypothetical protein